MAEVDSGEVMRKALKPAGHGNYDEVERLYGVCHCPNRSSVIFFDNNIIQLVRIFAPYGVRAATGHLFWNQMGHMT